MKNILVLGTLPKTDEEKKLYEAITGICEEFSDTINTPIDTAKFLGTNEERYKRAFELVKESDLVIGESSSPSTGQGMEIRECDILGKTVIIIAKEGSRVSGLLKGCPAVKNIILYSGTDDLELQLKDSILKNM